MSRHSRQYPSNSEKRNRRECFPHHGFLAGWQSDGEGHIEQLQQGEPLNWHGRVAVEGKDETFIKDKSSRARRQTEYSLYSLTFNNYVIWMFISSWGGPASREWGRTTQAQVKSSTMARSPVLPPIPSKFIRPSFFDFVSGWRCLPRLNIYKITDLFLCLYKKPGELLSVAAKESEDDECGCQL